MEDRCVCCGTIIPEGRHICPNCEQKAVDKYPYKVYDSTGTQVLQAPADCRHDKKTELSLLESGHTIKLHGKRITKKEVKG